MPTLEEIKNQIKSLEHTDQLGTKKEIKYLPEILRQNEAIKGLTSGFMNGNTWLIVCTNYRVIFLDKGMLYGLKQVETPLEKINSIEQKTGLMLGTITIWDGSSKMSISNVIKNTVRPFTEALNTQIDNATKSQGSSNDGEDTASQLLKLADLKEKGILTEEEFQSQKKKILAA